MKPLFTKGQNVHCEYCNTPVDIWEPLNTYQGRCCELYSDIFDLVFDNDVISFEELLAKSNYLRYEYNDIPDFEVTMKEIFDRLEDCGVVNS